MYMISAFYKGYEGDSLISKTIRLATWSDISHVENICLTDGHSYSSTMLKDEDGCRRKKILYSHPERWDFIQVPINNNQAILSWMYNETLKNMGYDMLGCLSLAWIRYRENPLAWFCSEFCRRAYTVDGTLPKLRKSRPLNPKQLRKELLTIGKRIEFDPRWLGGDSISR